jgi:hypothetical protein
MSKIVRLTEADLARIVKRVINENKDEEKDKYPTSLKAAAKLWVKSDKNERRKIKDHILKTGVTPEKFLNAIGDVYDSQW